MTQDGGPGNDAVSTQASTQRTPSFGVHDFEHLEHLEQPDEGFIPCLYPYPCPPAPHTSDPTPAAPASPARSDGLPAAPRYQRHYANASVLICSIPVRPSQAAGTWAPTVTWRGLRTGSQPRSPPQVQPPPSPARALSAWLEPAGHRGRVVRHRRGRAAVVAARPARAHRRAAEAHPGAENRRLRWGRSGGPLYGFDPKPYALKIEVSFGRGLVVINRLSAENPAD